LLARELLRRPKVTGESVIWSFDNLQVVAQSLAAIDDAAPPLIVYISADGHLEDYCSEWMVRHRWVASKDVATRLLAQFDAQVCTLMSRLAGSFGLTLNMGSPVWHTQDPYADDVDAFFDLYVENALRTLDWLKVEHAAPRVTRGAFAALMRSWAPRMVDQPPTSHEH
jgi:hypothetical protein